MSSFGKLSDKNTELKDFLAENNPCGQSILQLVSRGNAIIAEILRLKDFIPQVLKLQSKEEVQKYKEIILDFSYLKTAEAHESRIEANDTLRELDEEFRDNHIETIKRFYIAFESIHSYIIDLNHYIEEIEDGIYIHQTLESIFQDTEGKQLMCESLFLYGLMLYIVDDFIEGSIRERLLVCYNRYITQRSHTQSSFDEVCKLLRDTGINTSKKPLNYPEDYFKRIPINVLFAEAVIDSLRAEDIYSQMLVFPLPRHRSTALAMQGSMLYICLFFSPNILHSETAIMREIVDKYFPDNWVISLYMGFLVNLAEAWDNFRAAKLALLNTIQIDNIKNIASGYGQKLRKLLKTTNDFLKEGNISKENILREINDIVNVLRECNAALRWLMLHTIPNPLGTADRNDKMEKLKQYNDLVVQESQCEQLHLFKLLLNTAQLELMTKDLYKSLMLEKELQWNNLKEHGSKILLELAEAFSGLKPLIRFKKNSRLEAWFQEIAKQIQSLEREEITSSRKLVQFIQALQEVQKYHQLDTNMQVVQFLSETQKDLEKMILTMNIREDALINLQIIGDISYAWKLVDFYTNIMQNGIKREPKLVVKLRAIFLKLSSALELPLLRINQAHSEDMVSVSKYYSKELEVYVRKVLQVIPNTMFEKMGLIIEMQTNVLKEVPSRMNKDKLRDFAQLDERFEFAGLTYSISILSQGMRMMESTLIGVVYLDPKQLLEDGIRKELVEQISKALHNEFRFSSKLKVDELKSKLKTLSLIMHGYKKSFEYIQDYININGLKIWQEEVTRIINYNVEIECNGVLRIKVLPWQSVYQNRFVPIPIYNSIDKSENFIGRLSMEIIRITDPKSSIYLPITSSWYDIKSHNLIFNKETIGLIEQCIEITGLVGLDKLFSFMITNALQRVVELLENRNITNNIWVNVLNTIHNDIKQHSGDWTDLIKNHQTYVNRTTKIWQEFLEKILLIGQLQLIRSLIEFHLNKSYKFNAKNLESSLNLLNRSLLLDVKQGNNIPSENSLRKFSEYLDYAGLNEPLNKVYLVAKSNADYAITIFIFLLAHVKSMFLPQNKCTLGKRTCDQLDGVTITVALHTVFKQFHIQVNHDFIKHVIEYCTELIKLNSSKQQPLPEVIALLNFMDCYINYSEATRTIFNGHFPEEILFLQQSINY